MKFQYAYLAEKAEPASDGRLFVFGGEINLFTVPSFPGAAAASLIVRCSVQPNEVDKPHTFGLTRVRPNGEIEKPCEGMPVKTKPNTADPAEPSGAMLVISIHGMPLAEAGKNVFKFVIDGQEDGELPFFVQETAKGAN